MREEDISRDASPRRPTRLTGVADVSVAVATRDRPDFLRRLLHVLSQSEILPCEIVIADQSDDDQTAKVINSWDARGIALRYVRDARKGLGVAQNLAFSHSTGAIVAVTDDDCEPSSGWLAEIARAFAADPTLSGITGPVLPLPADDPALVPVSSRTSLTRKSFLGKHVPWDVGSGNNFAVRREWLEAVGGNDERLGAGAPGRGGNDMDLFYRLLRAGARIVYEPACLVRHARATPAERLARRIPYGFGTGANVGIWLRERDWYAFVVIGKWLHLRLRRVREGILTNNWTLVYEEMLILLGTARGILFGLRAGPKRPISYVRSDATATPGN